MTIHDDIPDTLISKMISKVLLGPPSLPSMFTAKDLPIPTDRVIGLQTFYTIVTGNRPNELHVGYREMGDIRKEARDIPVYSSPERQRNMLGTLIGMQVFRENKSHHMEIK